MQYAESQGLDNVISWVFNGRGIMVHNPDRLVEILPLFFSQTKYRSFRRQLNMWHFERVEKGSNKGAFIHPYFVRDNKELCGYMSRQIALKPKRENSFGSSSSGGSDEKATVGKQNAIFTLPYSKNDSEIATPTNFNIPLDAMEPNPIRNLPSTSLSSSQDHHTTFGAASLIFPNATISQQASALGDITASMSSKYPHLRQLDGTTFSLDGPSPNFVQSQALAALEPEPIGNFLQDNQFDPLDISFDDFDLDIADLAAPDFLS